MNTLTSNQITLIENAAKKLMHANNSVTTLEIKNQLRKDHPNNAWYQSDISEVMDYFYQQGVFDYNDNGTYRVYFDPVNPVGITGPTGVTSVITTGSTQPGISFTVTVPKKVAKPKKNVVDGGIIGKTKALDLITNSKGKIFSVVFTKKDGSDRKMTCRYKGLSPLGYVIVTDMSVAKKGEVDTREVNIQTLKQLKINNTLYKVNV